MTPQDVAAVESFDYEESIDEPQISDLFDPQGSDDYLSVGML